MLAQNIHMPIMKGVSTLWNSTVVTSYLFTCFCGSSVLELPSFFLSTPETVFASLLLTPAKCEKLIRIHLFSFFFLLSFWSVVLYLWGLYFSEIFFRERNYGRKQMVLNLFTCFLLLITSFCCLTLKKRKKKNGFRGFYFVRFAQSCLQNSFLKNKRKSNIFLQKGVHVKVKQWISTKCEKYLWERLELNKGENIGALMASR